METVSLPVYTKLNELENELQNLKLMLRTHSPKKQFLRAAGVWSDLDTVALKKKICERRELSTRSKVEL